MTINQKIQIALSLLTGAMFMAAPGGITATCFIFVALITSVSFALDL